MPPKVHEAVTLNEDGSYSVFINACINRESQQDAYLHAMEHISSNDFYCNESADEIEYRTHNKSTR